MFGRTTHVYPYAVHPRLVDLGLLVLRVPLGLYFLIAGFNKMAGEGSVGRFVTSTTQSTTMPTYLSPQMATGYLWALPFVEFLTGLLLLIGLLVRFNAFLMALMLVSFMMAATGVNPNVARIVDTAGGTPFHANVIYLAVTVALILMGGGAFGVGRAFRRRTVTVTAPAVAATPAVVPAATTGTTTVVKD